MLPYLSWMGLWLKDLAVVQHHINLITKGKRRNYLRKKVIACFFLVPETVVSIRLTQLYVFVSECLHCFLNGICLKEYAYSPRRLLHVLF